MSVQISLDQNPSVHGVRRQGRLYRLRGQGWNKKLFEILKKEAREQAKVVVLDDESNSHIFPISEMEWDDD